MSTAFRGECLSLAAQLELYAKIDGILPGVVAAMQESAVALRLVAKPADEGRGSDAAEADRYFNLAGEFGNRIQRAVTLVEDYDRHGSVDHAVAFELKKNLDPESTLSTTGEPKR